MKKIIAAFDGLSYSETTAAYAIDLAKKTNTHIVGVFLDDILYSSTNVYNLITEGGDLDEKLREATQKDKRIRDIAAQNFEDMCSNAALDYSMHHDRNIALQELKLESIYSDLLIIDSKETLTHYKEKAPTHFMRDLLGDAQCPVLVVQKKYKPITKLILLYDGEPSSVHAIKMFSYLLPQLKHLTTEVISVKPADSSMHLPDNKLMKELMKRHFPNAKYTVLKGDAELEIVSHLKQEEENAVVVLGAYRRGTVSRWFRESMADVLMKEIKMPLFIAHSK